MTFVFGIQIIIQGVPKGKELYEFLDKRIGKYKGIKGFYITR